METNRCVCLGAAILLAPGLVSCSPDWNQICHDLQARAEQCGQVVLPSCSETTFADCDNEGDIAEQLEGCAESCEALRDCAQIVCEQ